MADIAINISMILVFRVKVRASFSANSTSVLKLFYSKNISIFTKSNAERAQAGTLIMLQNLSSSVSLREQPLNILLRCFAIVDEVCFY